jgi:hypothetical protein
MGRHELEHAAPEPKTANLALNDAKEAAYDAKEAVREAQREEQHLEQPLQREEPTTLKIAHAAERVWDKMMDATVTACNAIAGKPADPALPPADSALAAAGSEGLVEMRQVNAAADEKIDEKRIAKDAWDVAKDTASGLKQAIIKEPLASATHGIPKPRTRHIKPDNTVLPVMDNVAKSGIEMTDKMREAGAEGWEATQKAAEQFDTAGNLPLKNRARRNRRARKAMKERTYADVAATEPLADATA